MPKNIIIVLLLTTFAVLTISTQKAHQLKGIASYYHPNLEGNKTASGEIYNQDKLTAAHRTLPFGTKVKVTNLKNGKYVTVIINDRGPYAKKRVIDLSYAAAQKIDLLRYGITEVKLEILTINED